MGIILAGITSMNYTTTFFSRFRLKFLSIIALVFLIASSSFAQKKAESDGKSSKTTVVAGVKYYLHTLEKGQTLFAIAKIYGRMVNDLVIENPEAIDGIKPGQVLKIPFDKSKPREEASHAKETPSIDSSKYSFHKVEKGQTLYSISKQYKVTEEKIKAANPDITDGIKIGQTLKIPVEKTKKETPTKEKEVAVKEKTTKEEKTAKEEKAPADKKEKKEKKEKGVKQEEVTTGKVQTAEEKPKEVKKDTIVPSIYKSKIKSEYNIAFFLPFHADEANAIDIDKLLSGEEQLSNKSNVALSFFEGAMIAIDSLKKQKLNAKIYVYDIDDKDSANVVNLLKKPELTKMDLMIGPLYGSGFIPVSKFAKENNIPIVSPFIQINKILFNNPFVCKVIPSTTLQVEQMAHYVVDSFGKQNIILVDNSNTRESSFFNAFKNTANTRLQAAGLSANDSVKLAKGLGGVEAMLSSTKTNVVVLPSTNQPYVTEFIRGLRGKRDKFKIVLFGLQNWTSYDNLDFEYLNDLSLHIAANTFIDYSNPATVSFINKYRTTYKTEPEMYVYQGFDIAYYFISELQKNGTGFLKTISEHKFHGIETDYDFKQFPSDSGFENKFVHILKYKDYKLEKAN